MKKLNFVARPVDMANYGPCTRKSEFYTLTRTEGMKLYMLDWRSHEYDGDWYSEWSCDMPIEFWAHGDDTALVDLVKHLKCYHESLGSMPSEEGLADDDIREWVGKVMPTILDLSTYAAVTEVVAAHHHVQYVVRKMAELYGAICDAGIWDALLAECSNEPRR